MFLDDMLKQKREGLQALEALYIEVLAEGKRKRPMYSLSRAIRENTRVNQRVGIIAEFKRRSPKNPELNPKAKLTDYLQAYEQGPALGVSVLTEDVYFGGSYDDLRDASTMLGKPLLCKDFIIDVLQIQLAYQLGADAILLIGELGTGYRGNDGIDLEALIDCAHVLKLEVLLEVHSKRAYESIQHLKFDVLGINNRNLKTLEVTLETTKDLSRCVTDRPVITESGIRNLEDLTFLEGSGIQGALIGEAFMRCRGEEGSLKDEIIAALKEFSQVPPKEAEVAVIMPMSQVKICGVQSTEIAKLCEQLGVEAVGVVFAKSSRRVTLETARAIKAVLKKTLLVAVFKDQSKEEIEATARDLVPDFVQVYDNQVYTLPPTTRVIRSVSYENQERVKLSSSAYYLIDHPHPGQGLKWDWAIGVLPRQATWIAGGLTPENVKACVLNLQPFGVDVSSGVETDGQKDPIKIRAFIQAVKGVKGV
jgi:indole-3-glycerol phosphate synthase/phosphoribosylanthranilate isomerase